MIMLQLNKVSVTFKIVSLKEVFLDDHAKFYILYVAYLWKRMAFASEYKQHRGSGIPLVPKHVLALHHGQLEAEMGSLAHLDTQIGEQKNASGAIKGTF